MKNEEVTNMWRYAFIYIATTYFVENSATALIKFLRNSFINTFCDRLQKKAYEVNVLTCNLFGSLLRFPRQLSTSSKKKLWFHLRIPWEETEIILITAVFLIFFVRFLHKRNPTHKYITAIPAVWAKKTDRKKCLRQFNSSSVN